MKLKADLSALTPEQQAAYAKINSLVGLGPDEATYTMDANSQPKNLVLSSDPEESSVPPHFVPVGSIAELRKVAGYDDIHPKPAVRQEDEAHYPAALSASEKKLLSSQPNAMKPTVHAELKQKIEKAATAYVMLDPDRVREYEPLINATMFPGKVAVFAAADLYVPPGDILKLSGPDGTIYNYGTVTVGKGASIQVDVNCIFNCQIFTQE